MAGLVEKKQELTLWLRLKCLELTQASLRAYQEFKTQDFMDFAKYFGELSAQLKKEYEG